MKTNAIFRESLEEIVFAGRNTAYGAYDLRINYPKTLNRATGIAATFLLLISGIPMLANLYSTQLIEGPATEISVEITHMEAPPVVPPPPPEIPVQMENRMRFVLPLITTNGEESGSLLIQDELNALAMNKPVDSLLFIHTDPVVTTLIAETGKQEPFTVVEEMPEFAGGHEAMLNFLKNNLVYPELARNTGIAGTVYIEFVVDEKGEISELVIRKGIGGGCDEEALRVIRLMSWKAGKQAGKLVPVRFTIPIKFVLKG